MKKKLFLLVLCFSFLSCQNELWDKIHELEGQLNSIDGRVARLEELCKEMNTNIDALQTIVDVMLNNDYIINVTPIMKDGVEIGYTITFAQHEPITIYHGQNGADGTNPQIGVKLDADGAYYWTLNGEWLINDNGDRIPVTSRDGKAGQDGKDGENGKDGKDGVTPQLKIENDYWYISYSDGVWIKLGKATGEDGKDGADGINGKNGDSMFSDVTQDDSFVYFTLSDGTILQVAKYKDDTVQIIDGAIMAEYSVSDSTKVYFSMGDLFYSDLDSHLCYDGTTRGGTYMFGDCLSINYSLGEEYTNYFKNKSSGSNIYTDWGEFNAIKNGGNVPNMWRTLTREEWYYLMGRNNNGMWLSCTIFLDSVYNTPNGTTKVTRGVIIFPDNYLPFPILTHIHSDSSPIGIPFTLLKEWFNHGAILLSDNHWLNNNYYIYNSTIYGNNYYTDYVRITENTNNNFLAKVRLVKDVK
ncbi:MAG: hypothetical protein IKN91_01980 [Paludibacteraceae bacterium]|nr:hypothetical protein [Paludibacteraceae bacterium]